MIDFPPTILLSSVSKLLDNPITTVLFIIKLSISTPGAGNGIFRRYGK